MTNSESRQSPLQKMARFYLEQVEQSAPLMKNAVDDWHQYCDWCYCTASEAQTTLLKRAGLAASWLEPYQALLQTAAQSGLKAQAEWSKASIENAIELTRTLVKNLDNK